MLFNPTSCNHAPVVWPSAGPQERSPAPTPALPGACLQRQLPPPQLPHPLPQLFRAAPAHAGWHSPAEEGALSSGIKQRHAAGQCDICATCHAHDDRFTGTPSCYCHGDAAAKIFTVTFGSIRRERRALANVLEGRPRGRRGAGRRRGSRRLPLAGARRQSARSCRRPRPRAGPRESPRAARQPPPAAPAVAAAASPDLAVGTARRCRLKRGGRLASQHDFSESLANLGS